MFAVFLSIVLPLHVYGEPATCSYQTYQWNVVKKKAVNRRKISHRHDKLGSEEVHPATGCTVCMEDQVAISIPGLEKFYLCHLIADEVQTALEQLIFEGAVIDHVTGYRVGMTKGPVDSFGNRKRFSYHSYGIAIDINEQQNGLYDRCLQFDEQCRLRRGGRWNPHQRGSLTRDSAIVTALERIGLKWGGNILGNQKDFMHFSPTGY